MKRVIETSQDQPGIRCRSGRGEAEARVTEDSPRTTNEDEVEVGGSPHWTISATGSSESFVTRPYFRQIRHTFAIGQKIGPFSA